MAATEDNVQGPRAFAAKAAALPSETPEGVHLEAAG